MKKSMQNHLRGFKYFRSDEFVHGRNVWCTLNVSENPIC